MSRSQDLLNKEKADNAAGYDKYLARVYTLLSSDTMGKIFECDPGVGTSRCMNVRDDKNAMKVVQRVVDGSALYPDRTIPGKQCLSFDLAEVHAQLASL